MHCTFLFKQTHRSSFQSSYLFLDYFIDCSNNDKNLQKCAEFYFWQYFLMIKFPTISTFILQNVGLKLCQSVSVA